MDLKDVLGKDGVADFFDAMLSQEFMRFLEFTGLGKTSTLHQVLE